MNLYYFAKALTDKELRNEALKSLRPGPYLKLALS